MTGKVVHQPPGEHVCHPGVTYEPYPEDNPQHPPPFPGARYAVLPAMHEYPAGTVWECDCDITWVSRGWYWSTGWPKLQWVRESARARRKREERDALAPGSGQRQHPSNVAPPPLSTKPVPQRENTESEHGNSPES